MSSFNTISALILLKEGLQITRLGWGEDYIYSKNGTIYDNNDNVFTFTTEELLSDSKVWYLYRETIIVVKDENCL